MEYQPLTNPSKAEINKNTIYQHYQEISTKTKLFDEKFVTISNKFIFKTKCSWENFLVITLAFHD